ncbi:peptide ABC transporter substrate-binding protein [Helicobacter monodelphidis]|uniref:ABC transporter ATP-binding protein n=1 Tax=Helicobacter sp. 15-1451 TaxID=2004995 RepID=UPI000DCC9DFC|nr:ABC transporter ATP-binding protein [Helicobacter sp. 15-1451]RAX57712.1 peptide ABC transporter substrate-binding protein [Helicobacter sp. 15-1451]
MLDIQDFTLHRGNLCVADSLNLSLQHGKVYAILGPNGAGKSSLLGAIFGDHKYSGQISLKSKNFRSMRTSEWKKQIGYMPQDNVVDANLSAIEVVLLGLIDHLGYILSDKQLRKAAEIMNSLGILHLAQKNILNLSGGQRQMVMFASVLLKSPQILLLDEPVSALDVHHQCILLEAVRKHTYAKDLITLMVLHDISLAAQFADELIILADTKIQAFGEPKKVITKELIERLYRVCADVFEDRSGLPIVAIKSALVS